MSGSMKSPIPSFDEANAVLVEKVTYLSDDGAVVAVPRGAHVWVDTTDHTMKLSNGDWLEVGENAYELLASGHSS